MRRNLERIMSGVLTHALYVNTRYSTWNRLKTTLAKPTKKITAAKTKLKPICVVMAGAVEAIRYGIIGLFSTRAELIKGSIPLNNSESFFYRSNY